MAKTAEKLVRILAAIVLFAFVGFAAYPAPWNPLNRTPLRLGLDLQGGVHLVYEADVSAVPDGDKLSALDGARDVIERRVNAFGVAEASVSTAVMDGKYQIVIDLPGVQDVKDAVAQIGETPVLNFRLPKKDVPAADAEATPEQKEQLRAANATEMQAAEDLLARVKGGEDIASVGGVAVTNVTADDAEYGALVKSIRRFRAGLQTKVYEGAEDLHVVRLDAQHEQEEPKAHHILISWAGATSSEQTRTKEEALALIQQIAGETNRGNFIAQANKYTEDPSGKDNGGDLGYVKPGEMVKPFEDALFALKDRAVSEPVETPFGYHLIYRESTRKTPMYDLTQVALPWTTLDEVVKVDPWEDTALSGKHIQSASVALDQRTQQPYVALTFNAEGAELFGRLTEENVGNVIGIFLDGYPVSTPVVQQAIYGGTAQISGKGMTLADAKALAQSLTSGALPVPVSQVFQQTVGPTLGESSLKMGTHAALLGVALVALFMLLYYRLAGLVAVVALAFYGAANLALFSLFDVTMTLSGIAGFAFSFGIAVDANVLVFERLKEELRAGRDLPSAVEEAFHRAWPSIRDGNITTLIATAILYSMSTGFIRGFALTLTIGVLMSMFSAYVVTRSLLRLLVDGKGLKKRAFFLGAPKA